MGMNGKELLENDAEEYDIFLKKFFNNSYFLHVEHIIMGLLSDDDIDFRRNGRQLIDIARYDNNSCRFFCNIFSKTWEFPFKKH